MKINQEFFIYPVGTFYDPNFENIQILKVNMI